MYEKHFFFIILYRLISIQQYLYTRRIISVL